MPTMSFLARRFWRRSGPWLVIVLLVGAVPAVAAVKRKKAKKAEPEPTATAAAPAKKPALHEEDSIPLFTLDASKTLLSQDWEGGFLSEGEKGYQILLDLGRPFIRATYTPGQRLEYLYKKVDWNMKERPILAWRWRVQKYPPNAKVMDMSRSDAAAQVYIVWSLGVRKRVIKYYWGVNDGLGDEIKQSNFFAGQLWGKVVRNGPPWGDWQRQVRNVARDYKEQFGEDPPEKAGAVAIMSDGDDSKGEAEADYADFRIVADPKAPTPPAPLTPN